MAGRRRNPSPPMARQCKPGREILRKEFIPQLDNDCKPMAKRKGRAASTKDSTRKPTKRARGLDTDSSSTVTDSTPLSFSLSPTPPVEAPQPSAAEDEVSFLDHVPFIPIPQPLGSHGLALEAFASTESNILDGHVHQDTISNAGVWPTDISDHTSTEFNNPDSYSCQPPAVNSITGGCSTVSSDYADAMTNLQESQGYHPLDATSNTMIGTPGTLQLLSSMSGAGGIQGQPWAEFVFKIIVPGHRSKHIRAVFNIESQRSYLMANTVEKAGWLDESYLERLPPISLQSWSSPRLVTPTHYVNIHIEAVHPIFGAREENIDILCCLNDPTSTSDAELIIGSQLYEMLYLGRSCHTQEQSG